MIDVAPHRLLTGIARRTIAVSRKRDSRESVRSIADAAAHDSRRRRGTAGGCTRIGR